MHDLKRVSWSIDHSSGNPGTMHCCCVIRKAVAHRTRCWVASSCAARPTLLTMIRPTADERWGQASPTDIRTYYTDDAVQQDKRTSARTKRKARGRLDPRAGVQPSPGRRPAGKAVGVSTLVAGGPRVPLAGGGVARRWTAGAPAAWSVDGYRRAAGARPGGTGPGVVGNWAHPPGPARGPPRRRRGGTASSSRVHACASSGGPRTLSCV